LKFIEFFLYSISNKRNKAYDLFNAFNQPVIMRTYNFIIYVYNQQNVTCHQVIALNATNIIYLCH